MHTLPKAVVEKVKKAIFEKADKYGYAARARADNGRFMNDLLEDPEIGTVLGEYIEQGVIRTYIKDGVLNAYTKQKVKKILQSKEPSAIILKEYNENVKEEYCHHNVSICSSTSGRIFIISSGTMLKWETALRKALEIIARTSQLRKQKDPNICLQLAVTNGNITKGDIDHIKTALKIIGVKVYFSKE